MAAIAIKQEAYDNLTLREMQSLKNLTFPALGDPVILTDGEQDWCVFDDPRITDEMVLMISYAMGNTPVLETTNE